MKTKKRFTAGALATVLMVSTVPCSSFAAEENTAKEEVIYANIEHDGSVSEINVVNIFEMESKGEIIDYGTYESVRNMNTNDEINTSGDTITISTDSGKLYYEGSLNSTQLPWEISIDYFMDGTKYSAEEIAGKSGELKIAVKIAENAACKENFFDYYALQATFTLDSGKCTDIVADGATIANVGADKQLTYTILPGEGAEFSITANVMDFEMDSIAINGVKLNLDIEVDTEKLNAKIGEVIDAINTLDDGAGELNDGASELNDGASELNDGAAELSDATGLLSENINKLHSGVGQLASGASELSSGLSAITAKNDELLNGGYAAFKGLCTAAGTSLNAELAANGLNTVTLTPENYEKILKNLLKQMDADNVYDQAYQVALAEVTSQVEAQADALYAGYIDSITNTLYSEYINANADTLYTEYINSIADVLYAEYIHGNADTIYMQYLQLQLADSLAGMSDEQKAEVLSNALAALTDEQKVQIEEAAVASLTDEQKAQIQAGAVASLTDEQKAQIKENVLFALTDEQKTQIREGALASLTDEQKTQIREEYISQMMKSEEITSQLTAAVKAANEAAASIADLKGQLDNYSLFYDGLKSYVSAVSEAANGASTLKVNMNRLYKNTDILNTSIKTLDSAVKQLYSGTSELQSGTVELKKGTTELKEGTTEFVNETSGMNTQVEEEIDSMLSSISGGDEECVSFVSSKNTNVKSVQFIIKTEAIEVEEAAEVVEEIEETLTIWQKFLRLFGLY